MIKVLVDKDACVGCALCVDECPTDVFEFDEENSIPLVKKENECFGCFSCSEICPAEAITHEGVEICRNFYHDTYAMDVATKLTPGTPQNSDITDELEQDKALEDLGIRLLSIAAVFRHTLGGSLPAVGTMAGRTLANQLPRYHIPESFKEVLEMVVSQFSPSWDIQCSVEDDQLTITTKTCFVRELCQKEGIGLGGDLCVLFYNNIAGYLGKMSGKRIKLLSMEPGNDKCIYKTKTFEPRKI